MIGGLSDLTCFSFHAVKNLATSDGGMVTTNNKKLADAIKRLRWVGINKRDLGDGRNWCLKRDIGNMVGIMR